MAGFIQRSRGRGGARPAGPCATRARSLCVGNLGLEDGRTLRWSDPAGYHSFFDLRHVPCPSRPRFITVLRTDRVLLTQRRYASTIVLRGCDLATQRDVVVGEQESHIGNDGALDVIGVDRPWVLLRYSDVYRYDGSESVAIATADVATGDLKATFPHVDVPAPQAGSFAITAEGFRSGSPATGCLRATAEAWSNSTVAARSPASAPPATPSRGSTMARPGQQC